MGRASPNKTNSYAAKPKGLWLYTGDKRIGNYKSSDEWVAVPISTVARENGTGFASIIDAVKKYYDSIGMKRILKLAFVVHGDVGGVVQIYNNEKNIPKDIPTSEIEKYYNFMSPYTIFYFLEEIAKLNQYITKDAQVIFYSCMAGNGSEGSYLLEKISAKIPGKTVIAFTTLGESGVSYSGALKLKPAGIVYETGETRSYDHTKIYPVRKIDSKYSKHARDGKVITPAKLPPIEKNLPFFRPERIIYIKKNFFDFLLYDKHLYYLGIMLIGWHTFDKNKKFRGEVRTEIAIGEDYNECLNIIEKDEQYLKLKDQGLQKEYKQVDGVWVVHKTDIPKASYKLDDRKKEIYKKLKGTLTDEFQNDVPVIWRNNGNNKNKINAYINAMLQLISKGRKVQSSIINTIGKSVFDSIFKKPKY